MKFKDIEIGTIFNTFTARWKKISKSHAVCVMSGIVEYNKKEKFDPE